MTNQWKLKSNERRASVSADYQHCVMEATCKFANSFGYSRDEIIGRSFMILLAPMLNTKTIEDLFCSTKACESKSTVLMARRKGGSSFLLRMFASTEFEDQQPHFEVFIEDSQISPRACDYCEQCLQDQFTDSLNSDKPAPPARCRRVSDSNIIPLSTQRDEEQLLMLLSRQSTKMCRAILSYTNFHITDDNTAPPPHHIAGVPLTLIAHCARETLLAASDPAASGSPDYFRRLPLLIRLVEAEILPLAARWHRRDLVPALDACWRAVLRGLHRLASFAPSNNTGRRHSVA